MRSVIDRSRPSLSLEADALSALSAVAAMLVVSALAGPAWAQAARVAALVTRPGSGRDIAVTNDAVGDAAERLLARCEPMARAAAPDDSQYFELDVDTVGRVTRVHSPA